MVTLRKKIVMDLEKIKEILACEFFDKKTQTDLILSVIAKDEKAIPMIMEILNYERTQKSELLKDINVLLSLAHTGLEDTKINKDGFIQQKILEFYIKNKKIIGHCFKNIDGLELPEKPETLNKQ
jgi:hypothetical protein